MELTFRVLACVFVLVGLAMRVYFQRRSGLMKKSVEQGKARGVLALAGVFTLVWFAAMVSYVVGWGWVQYFGVPLPLWMRWVGVGLGVVSAPFFFWVHWVLGENFNPTVYIREEQTLVEEGPYRWIRHPMYTAYLVSYLCYFLLTANVLIGVMGFLAIVSIMWARVPQEEAALCEKFGDAYQDYMRRTGRFLPRLRKG